MGRQEQATQDSAGQGVGKDGAWQAGAQPEGAARSGAAQAIAATDDAAFRQQLRAWLNDAYASFVRGWPGGAAPRDLDFRRAWEDALCASGWSGLGWPRDYGGQGLPLSRQAVFHEEHARCGAPLGVNLIGHGILAPTLLHFGSVGARMPWPIRFTPSGAPQRACSSWNTAWRDSGKPCPP